jgi:aspartate racemase
MRTIGIVAHSADGAALCFLTAVREGAAVLDAHMHPPIVMSAVPMGLSLAAWESSDYAVVASHLQRGVEQVNAAGADFFVCPDNTAHIVLEKMNLSLPGLHIAHVVCDEIVRKGWRKAGLLGTKWTMNGPVYESALSKNGVEVLVPDMETQSKVNDAIFDELCQGVVTEATTELFVGAIDALKRAGAKCVVLGCTEIPLVIGGHNSPLPVLDSTRLLARRAVEVALSENPLPLAGWIPAQSSG